MTILRSAAVASNRMALVIWSLGCWAGLWLRRALSWITTMDHNLVSNFFSYVVGRYEPRPGHARVRMCTGLEPAVVGIHPFLNSAPAYPDCQFISRPLLPCDATAAEMMSHLHLIFVIFFTTSHT